MGHSRIALILREGVLIEKCNNINIARKLNVIICSLEIRDEIVKIIMTGEVRPLPVL